MKLEKDKYYYCEYSNHSYAYIIKTGEKQSNTTTGICIKGSNSFFTNGSFTQSYTEPNLENLRNATKNEENWLKECIKQGKYIPMLEYKEEISYWW